MALYVGARVLQKFSDPKKPVTIAVPVVLPGRYRTTPELCGEIIRQCIELTGLIPFDWEHISQVPEVFQLETQPGDTLFVTYFGFGTMDEAYAVKAKFDAIKRRVIITTEAEEREKLQHRLEQIEEESDERPFYDAGDGRGPMYWRDHPYFQERPTLN
jgi:hypothetical protein